MRRGRDGNAGIEEWRVLHGIAIKPLGPVLQHTIHDVAAIGVQTGEGEKS